MGVKVRKPRGHTSWCVVIDHQGQRKTKAVGSREAAERVKREVEARLADGGSMGAVEPKNRRCPLWQNTPVSGWLKLNSPANRARRASTGNISGSTSSRNLARRLST